jgi:hypothetical protein
VFVLKSFGWFILFAGLLVGLPVTGAARDMKLTMYADGHSCPGGCDAHVVINAADNGTRQAFAPGSSREAPQRCQTGAACTICFGDGDDTCMQALYRGAGPPAGTFDFTPAFYDANCGVSGIPGALMRQCAALDAAVRSRGYDTRINCFAHPDKSRCITPLAAAQARRAADEPKRQRCLEIGQSAFNAEQNDPKDRRSNACSYSAERSGGPNSRGVTWRVLLPAACPEGSFVGRDGLDCCSSSTRFAAGIHPECSVFFPRP